jgi:SAM-dependent methyltransferase
VSIRLFSRLSALFIRGSCLSGALVLVFWTTPFARGQATTNAPVPDTQVYEAFRSWVNQQPGTDRSMALDRYKGVLTEQGVAAAEIDRRLQLLRSQGDRLEVDRWNRILTSASPKFNTQPNAFLVQMTKEHKPGKALDVGMGQGRNAIYLARQGWNVTGFDPADKAVALAKDEARRLGVELTTQVVDDEHFDFGREQWDLIVLSYVSLRHLPDRLYDSLKPGGLVVVEGFHRDATKNSSIGAGVVFETNELLKIFQRYRIIHYEDADGLGDFGLQNTRVVRLAAQKPL